MKKFLIIMSLILIARYTSDEAQGGGDPFSRERYSLVVCYSPRDIPAAGCTLPNWAGPCDRFEKCEYAQN